MTRCIPSQIDFTPGSRRLFEPGTPEHCDPLHHFLGRGGVLGMAFFVGMQAALISSSLNRNDAGRSGQVLPIRLIMSMRRRTTVNNANMRSVSGWLAGCTSSILHPVLRTRKCSG